MFYKLIKRKSDEWYKSSECTVNSLIDYMIEKGELRDAQIEAIKIYIYLKINCDNKNLIDLIKEGYFCNTEILDNIELTSKQKEIFKNNYIALTLLEYSNVNEYTDEEDVKTLNTLKEYIKENCENIDFENELNNILKTNNYAEYVFSLPMGAGKTYLMACFIYLDLYFALNEPDNKNFAHNFLIMAPSGLKNSIVPSLRTIENFDPTFVLPEPTASQIKSLIRFEALDQDKTGKKSNLVNNPNVQKILRNGEPTQSFGLILVVNAEKLILNKDGELSPMEDYLLQVQNDKNDYEHKKKTLEYERSNELRNIIGKIPNLTVFVDEIHHVVSDEIKARQVINKWAESGNINSVAGFSGTPYLDTPIILCSLKTKDIPQIVYYYPLIEGIDNFLKHPEIIISDATDSKKIVKKGIKEFFENFDIEYKNGTTSKLAIYCGRIERLNKEIYPVVLKEISKYGLTADNILRFYGESKVSKEDEIYKLEKDAEYQFLRLDKPDSIKRVVLLVGIGKEGWDCKSLTGVILSQKGDCDKKVVLQTSCRALRKIDKNRIEKALIVLNEDNADILNKELKQICHTNIEALQNQNNSEKVIKFYNRTEKLKLPAIDYIDLEINTKIETIKEVDTKDELNKVLNFKEEKNDVIKKTDVKGLLNNRYNIDTDNNSFDYGSISITYEEFCNEIRKRSFNIINNELIKEYDDELNKIFTNITYSRIDDNEIRFAKELIDIDSVYRDINLSFANNHSISQTEEKIPKSAKLLHIENFVERKYVENAKKYFPNKSVVESIVDADNGKIERIDTEEIEKTIKQLEKIKQYEQADALRKSLEKDTNILDIKDKSYHYIPYKSDSDFEKQVYDEILSLDIFKKRNIEAYFNGDDNLTEFKISCYEISNGIKKYIGKYIPDFLIISRDKKNVIKKVLILETKGKIYASDEKFIKKRKWTEEVFLNYNNENYKKYDYLYIEDSWSDSDRINKISDKISRFFEEDK